jgi:hypothetical protein
MRQRFGSACTRRVLLGMLVLLSGASSAVAEVVAITVSGPHAIEDGTVTVVTCAGTPVEVGFSVSGHEAPQAHDEHTVRFLKYAWHLGGDDAGTIDPEEGAGTAFSATIGQPGRVGWTLSVKEIYEELDEDEEVVGELEGGSDEVSIELIGVRATIGDVTTRGANLPHSMRNRGATVAVNVTIDPENVASVIFDITGGAQATVTENATRMTSGTITVTSTADQTGIGVLPLRVRGRVGAVDCAVSNPFAVCAHPVNYHQIVGNDAGGGVLHFEYAWDSDSAVTGDLNAVDVTEHVSYPGGNPYNPANPPFTGPGGGGWNISNPTILPAPPAAGSDGGLQDNHGNLAMAAGPASSFTGTQYYRYACNRCGAGPHNDHTRLMGPIAITRYVENVGGWRYCITKSGVSATRPVP